MSAAKLREIKKQVDSELAVYLLTLQAKVERIGQRSRNDALSQALHRLRTVANEVINTPVNL